MATAASDSGLGRLRLCDQRHLVRRLCDHRRPGWPGDEPGFARRAACGAARLHSLSRDRRPRRQRGRYRHGAALGKSACHRTGLPAGRRLGPSQPAWLDRRPSPASGPACDRMERAAGQPLHRGIRAGGARLVLGNDRARGLVLRVGSAGRRPQDARHRADRQGVHRLDRHRRQRRYRDVRAHLGLPSFGPAALHRCDRAGQDGSGDLVVAVRHAELRRAWPLPRLPRHRLGPHPAAALRAGDQPPRQI